MKYTKIILASLATAMLATAPVMAQETPVPGTAGGQEANYLSMPVGSHVMIGGFIFLVVVGGLILVNDDDSNPAAQPTPTPTPTPATTTTTTTG